MISKSNYIKNISFVGSINGDVHLKFLKFFIFANVTIFIEKISKYSEKVNLYTLYMDHIFKGPITNSRNGPFLVRFHENNFSFWTILEWKRHEIYFCLYSISFLVVLQASLILNTQAGFQTSKFIFFGAHGFNRLA